MARAFERCSNHEMVKDDAGMDPVSDSPRVLGNRYEVGDLLGRGGMAEVRLGRDTRLGRVVAIKLLRVDLARDPVFQTRFRREAQSAASLNHPAIVSVYDTGEEQMVEMDGTVVALPFIVMEYVEGRTLRELLVDEQPIDIGLALEVCSGVLAALDYSHRAGIVHRDIKPANVMLTPTGDVKVMDFGIARALADASVTMTATQAVIGTAQYLSPEQARGETVDARSDLYSAGCLLFELVTGRPPFVAESPVAVAYQHVREAPPKPTSLNPAIPDNLQRVILHSLAKDRERRYQSAGDFKHDVDNVRTGRQVAISAQSPAGAHESGSGATTEYYGQPLTGARGMGSGSAAVTVAVPGYGQGYAEPQYDEQYGQGYDPEYADTGQALGATTLAQDGYGGRRGAGAGGPGRGVGFVLLGAAAIALFVAVAYLVYSVIGTSADAQKVRVPTVVGLSQTDARARLEALQLKVVTTLTPSDTVPSNNVIEQTPSGTVSAGSTITLTVSSGSGSAQVPDVANFTQDAAREAIKSAGLEPGNTESVDSAVVQKDKVIGTDPKALVSVPKGTTVKILMSTGQVEVPDLSGKTFDEATALLEDLNIAVTRNDVESGEPEGTIVGQDLVAGSKVEAGNATITLDVAVAFQAQEQPTDDNQDGQQNDGNQDGQQNDGNQDGQQNDPNQDGQQSDGNQPATQGLGQGRQGQGGGKRGQQRQG